ncbi:ion transporter [Stratiformator vulcanicus]|uniref:Cyclic nucleotide-gated potassium channel n=1 Tax=Stratiformator vulcanicus TaxID=2527980 RepID=A0A517R2V3_9PLAN|nr:ion transporter [Stratiformator vulcanicus]QDT38205.1 Cyclic nucleotide-gated potassium channel [Stratiformator vulcanicus]
MSTSPPDVPNAIPKRAGWREHWYEIIFEADTPAGKLFDVWLLAAIMGSVVVLMLESVEDLDEKFHAWFDALEWFFTLVFTVEYTARIVVARRRWRYMFSFFGLVDLVSILPSYLMLVIPGAERITVIRMIRLLRAFRVFKIASMIAEARLLREAIIASRSKIAVFLSCVVIAVVIVGTAMYTIEGTRDDSPFTSIPQSMYWAVVTMTTVGYGDIAPQTALGKALAAAMMLFGYSLIIVPTGILTAELATSHQDEPPHVPPPKAPTLACPECMAEGHDPDAGFCKFCGAKL